MKKIAGKKAVLSARGNRYRGREFRHYPAKMTGGKLHIQPSGNLVINDQYIVPANITRDGVLQARP
jgi:hypothetical protein